MLCLKAMSRFAIYVPHFNYATNILSALIRLSLSNCSSVVSEVCNTLNQVFREDLHLRMSLFGARSIASMVSKRKGCVPPQLIATLLSLNIKEVKDESKKSGKRHIQAKRAKLKKEKANKTARKYKKQLDKLEADLKELDAAEKLSTKLKTATETMKHVFQCYFSVLKRVPNVALLEPVLEGLSKFAHLLGIEFFEDIVSTMENLVNREGLRLLDRLYCINTVFIILSGDGQLLNIDPSRFYRTIYREYDFYIPELIGLYLLKLPLSRVAAFVKRVLSIATIMDDPSALCLVALVRSFFIAHPKLVQLVEEDDLEGGAGGMFRPDIDDPDVSNALSSNVRTELKILSRRRHRSLSQFAQNVLHSVPSTGPLRLNPQLTSMLVDFLLYNSFNTGITLL
uniref:CBF domain-containing protein n=1 Tax=Angiostrongylus cantonensis TaxID=6313 RepID=A0A0K0D3A8_ANGCA